MASGAVGHDESPFLSVRDLTVRYRDRGVGVSGVSFDMRAGAVVCLAGPNGAGKTSVLRAIAGLITGEPAILSAGSITWLGSAITRHGAHARSRRGIALVPERDKVFPDLTVMENMRIGAMHLARKNRDLQIDLALEVFPHLRPHLTRIAGFLSGGQRQMLAISMALASKPTMLIVDELTLGLAPELVVTMTESVSRLVAESDLTILMAEQNVTVCLELAETIHVLESGRLVLSGAPDAVRSRAERAYLAPGER